MDDFEDIIGSKGTDIPPKERVFDDAGHEIISREDIEKDLNLRHFSDDGGKTLKRPLFAHTQSDGRPKRTFTAEDRFLVKAWARVGTPQEVIASELGCTVPTLIKNFKQEIDQPLAKGVAEVGGTLYAKAVMGDTSSAIFYLKTKGRWKEPQAGDEETPLHIKGDIDIGAIARRMREARVLQQQTIEHETDKETD